jgi:hypothetical protein
MRVTQKIQLFLRQRAGEMSLPLCITNQCLPDCVLESIILQAQCGVVYLEADEA